MSEKLKISSNDELKTNLWLENHISFEAIKNPILATREELEKLKTELWKIETESEKTQKINQFIRDKWIISKETEEQLSEMMKDGSVGWFITWVTSSLEKTLNEDDGKQWIEKILSLWEKVTGWWDKMVLWFQTIMWKQFPQLAKLLWVEDPSEKLKAEAEEKNKQLQESAKAKQQEIQEKVKPWYALYSKIYFRFFRASSELDKDFNIDKKVESEVSRCLFENELFQSLKYNDLQNPTHIEKLYWVIKDNLKLSEEQKDETNIKKYIWLVLKSISGWEEKTQTWWFDKEKTQTIERWNLFLKTHYKDIEKENPSMKDLFSKLTHLWDFALFWDDSKWFDLEWVKDSLKGKLQTLYTSWVTNISNLTERDFDGLKWWLHAKLQNLWDFQIISTSILQSSESRTLDKNFDANGVTDSITTGNEKVKNFVWNEQDGLIKYWNDIFQNFFQSWYLIWSSVDVKKSDLTLKKVYSIFLITGWETDVSKLSPMQKLNLTFNLMVWYGEAEDIWGWLWNMTKKLINNEIKVDNDVKNMLLSIWKAAMDVMKDSAKFLWEIGWGFAKENPAMALAILVIALKFPFFTRRHSLM